jgi:hypothetical protein
MVEGEY